MVSYRVNLIFEDNIWSVTSPDVPGANTWGHTKAEALERAKGEIGSILDLPDGEYEALEIEPWFYESGSLVAEQGKTLGPETEE